MEPADNLDRYRKDFWCNCLSFGGLHRKVFFLYANLAFFEGDGLYEMCLYGYRENE